MEPMETGGSRVQIFGARKNISLFTNKKILNKTELEFAGINLYAK